MIKVSSTKIILISIPLIIIGYLGFTKFTTSKPHVKTDPEFYEIKGKVIEGFPENFPVYPGSFILGSATDTRDIVPNKAYRIKWRVAMGDPEVTVPKVMDWYRQELVKIGWSYARGDDYPTTAEMIDYVTGDDLKGYLAAETEDNDTFIEIIVDVRKEY